MSGQVRLGGSGWGGQGGWEWRIEAFEKIQKKGGVGRGRGGGGGGGGGSGGGGVRSGVGVGEVEVGVARFGVGG